jgi:hypothetical protein
VTLVDGDDQLINDENHTIRLDYPTRTLFTSVDNTVRLLAQHGARADQAARTLYAGSRWSRQPKVSFIVTIDRYATVEIQC